MTRFAMTPFLLLLFAVPLPVAARDDEPLETRVYRIVDLIMPARNYAYPASAIPTTALHESGVQLLAWPPGGMGGGMGGMGGMGGAGMGGGMFNLPAGQAAQFGGEGYGGGGMAPGMGAAGGSATYHRVGRTPAFSLTTDDLINTLTNIVAPESWDRVGGAGTIEVAGGLLVVSQTASIHQQIDQLLEMLRAEGGIQRTLVVEARWLVLDDDGLDQLLDTDDAAGAGGPISAVRLGELASTVPGLRGRISCFNGQTVYLVSGRRTTAITGAVPVVGSGPPAYSQSPAWPNVGALLQVQPVLVADEQSVIVDLESAVTAQPADGPVAAADPQRAEPGPDRINLWAQQLACTVRMPLGQPTLVGGMSLADHPAGPSSADDHRQLYLFLTVTLAE